MKFTFLMLGLVFMACTGPLSNSQSKINGTWSLTKVIIGNSPTSAEKSGISATITIDGSTFSETMVSTGNPPEMSSGTVAFLGGNEYGFTTSLGTSLAGTLDQGGKVLTMVPPPPGMTLVYTK